MNLQRVYLLSDCFGSGKESDDPDALITTDIRSALSIPVQREFDTWKEPRISDHVLRTILRLHAEIRRDIGITGVLVNSAPRVEKGVNGDFFYVASLYNGFIRIVAPLHALSPVRDSVEILHELPNENGLFRREEQFRSSFVPRLLNPDHGIPLLEVDRGDIPEFSRNWTLSYHDRFGNLVTFDNRRESDFDKLSDTVRIRIGEVIANVPVFSSLADADPGVLFVQQNDAHVEVLRKWREGETFDEILEKSAHEYFHRPLIGTPVSIEKSLSEV